MPDQSKKVSAFAPATIANAVAGFDVLGLALSEPGDIVTVWASESAGISIAPLAAPFDTLPHNADQNTAGVAVRSLLDSQGLDTGLFLEIQKGVPIVGGMGSSASSGVAAVVAVNELLGLGLGANELLPHVLRSEEMATGAPHADNAAPSLFGGFTIIRSLDPIDIVPLKPALPLSCVLVHPHMQIKTRDARNILPQELARRTATDQMGHVSGFIAGLLTGDAALVSRSMRDEIAEPHRGKLIPGYDRVKEVSLAAGALGCGISGSGPSMFALCPDQATARIVGKSMGAVFADHDLGYDLFISDIAEQGARILD